MKSSATGAALKFVKTLLITSSLMLGAAQAQTYLPDTSSNPLFGELLWHTLAYRQDVAVYPSAFVPRMPLEIALPENGRLIGSVVREYGSRSREVTIVIDSQLTYEEVGNFYRPKLKSPWQEQQPVASGFSYSRDVRNGNGYLPLCNPTTGTRVQIYGIPKDEANWQTSKTFIYINFFESAQTELGCQNNAWRFPVLLFPNNVEPFGGNGFGFGDFNYQSSNFLSRNTNAKKLFEGFAAQIPNTWQRLSLAEDDTSVVAVYRYNDPQQSGIVMLSVHSYKERPNAYVARLVALPQQ